MTRYLLPIPDAAAVLGVSERHIKRLIAEADASRKPRWRWGRELVDMAAKGSQRRLPRVNINAVVPGMEAP